MKFYNSISVSRLFTLQESLILLKISLIKNELGDWKNLVDIHKNNDALYLWSFC